jgi:hypothetical protein
VIKEREQERFFFFKNKIKFVPYFFESGDKGMNLTKNKKEKKRQRELEECFCGGLVHGCHNTMREFLFLCFPA